MRLQIGIGIYGGTKLERLELLSDLRGWQHRRIDRNGSADVEERTCDARKAEQLSSLGDGTGSLLSRDPAMGSRRYYTSPISVVRSSISWLHQVGFKAGLRSTMGEPAPRREHSLARPARIDRSAVCVARQVYVARWIPRATLRVARRTSVEAERHFDERGARFARVLRRRRGRRHVGGVGSLGHAGDARSQQKLLDGVTPCLRRREAVQSMSIGHSSSAPFMELRATPRLHRSARAGSRRLRVRRSVAAAARDLPSRRRPRGAEVSNLWPF